MSIHQMPPNLDNALKEAFRRQEPPDGFVDRVMAQVPQQRPQSNSPSGRWKREWLAIAASACMAVLGAGAWQQHQRQLDLVFRDDLTHDQRRGAVCPNLIGHALHRPQRFTPAEAQRPEGVGLRQQFEASP